MSSMISGKGTVHRAMGLRAAAFVMLLAMIAGCSGSDTAAPAASSTACAGAANCIGSAGGTATGPDGVTVVFPPGALTQPTAIGIARSAAGAPQPLQEGNAPAGPVYEFTPHDLVFNVPVTIRMPVPANGVGLEVFMASLGADWQVNDARLVNGFAEWQRNSFSFGLIGAVCAPPANDPYPCTYPRGYATASALPGVITQVAAGNWQQSAGSWVVNQAGTVSLTLNYSAAPDCSDTNGGPLTGHVKLIRWNPAVPLNTPNRVTTVRDELVSLISTSVTPPLGTFNVGGPTFRGMGSTGPVDVSSYLTDATNAFGFSFSCHRPNRPMSGGGDLVTIIGPMPAPGGPYTIGGTITGLTGTVVLQNNGGDSQTVTAPNNLFTFTPIAAGLGYGVSVQAQPFGQTCTVVQNGSGANVQANVPNVAVNCVTSGPVPLAATAIAAGFWNSLAVATDGTVWAWGDQVDPTTGGFKSTAPFATTPVQVQGLTGVKAVSVSSEAAAFYALHTDGTVSAWGNNGSGQLGDRTITTRAIPGKVLNGVNTPIDEVCSISAGNNFLVMARDESCSPGVSGVVSGPWIVGLLSGSIGGDSGGTISKAVPGLPSGVAVSQMGACSAANCGGAVLFRLANGNSYAWGNNSSNKLGAGTSTSFAGGTGGPADASFFWSGTSSVRLGRTFAVASTGTGSLVAVGGDLNGELGNGAAGSSSTLTPVSVLTNVSPFSAGQVNAAAVTNGELWVWGTLGNSVYSLTTPTRLGTGTGFTQVSVGDAHGLAIGPGGEVYSWGESTNGALGRSGSGSLPAVVMRP